MLYLVVKFEKFVKFQNFKIINLKMFNTIIYNNLFNLSILINGEQSIY